MSTTFTNPVYLYVNPKMVLMMTEIKYLCFGLHWFIKSDSWRWTWKLSVAKTELWKWDAPFFRHRRRLRSVCELWVKMVNVVSLIPLNTCIKRCIVAVLIRNGLFTLQDIWNIYTLFIQVDYLSVGIFHVANFILHAKRQHKTSLAQNKSRMRHKQNQNEIKTEFGSLFVEKDTFIYLFLVGKYSEFPF